MQPKTCEEEANESKVEVIPQQRKLGQGLINHIKKHYLKNSNIYMAVGKWVSIACAEVMD